MTDTSPPPSGLLVVDKPSGPTSHDVVGRMRRALGTRSIGHAGTLDPLATGVLLVMVGACTKLSRFLTLEEKAYRATVRLGTATDTLDAEGATIATGEVPIAVDEELARLQSGAELEEDSVLGGAVRLERARTLQVPPAHSAIKQDGVASYRKARRGEAVALPPRQVRVLSMSLDAATREPPEVQLTLHVSKGYYVRSMARDLGEALGVPSHLCALRRLRSGPWGLEDAVAMDAEPVVLRRSIVSIEQVARRSLPSCCLNESGARRAVYGQKLSDSDFDEPPGEGITAWFDPRGRLVAVGDRSRERPTVLRAFLHADEMC